MSPPPRPELDEMHAKIHPDAIRASLVRAGLFITGYEILKNEIVERVREFFMIGFDAEGSASNPIYESKVRRLHKKEFEACLIWLVSSGALSEHEAERVRAIRAHRNEVAHALPKFIVNPGTDVDVGLLSEMRDVIACLGRFWGAIEVSINPDFDGVDVEESEILSGALLLMDHLIAAAASEAR